MRRQSVGLFRGRFSRWSLIGVACVVTGSCLAVATMVQSKHAGQTSALIASHALPAGFQVQSVDVKAVEVAVPREFAKHLLTFEQIGHRRLSRAVAAGVALTSADFGANSTLSFSRITVDIGRMPMRLSRGDSVDLWATPDAVSALAGDDPETIMARRIASNLIVSAVGDSSIGTGRAVELQVPMAMVAGVIQATHSGSIDLVIRESAAS